MKAIIVSNEQGTNATPLRSSRGYCKGMNSRLKPTTDATAQDTQARSIDREDTTIITENCYPNQNDYF